MLKQCQCKPIAASSFVCTEGTSFAQAEAKGYERPTGRVRKPVVGSRDPCFDIGSGALPVGGRGEGSRGFV